MKPAYTIQLIATLAGCLAVLQPVDRVGALDPYAGIDDSIAYATTGVAKAHETGLSGAGQTIAIMDSGINYKHPALGACTKVGPGCRVRGGFDFVGDSHRDDGSFQPDSDPMDCKSDDFAHGTEVASVAAGDASYDKTKPWRGVAYRANLLAYKVSGSCSDYGATVSTNATLRAIRTATAAGADVLNLSYGDFRSGAYVDGRYARALVAAMQQGAMVTIASGNDGFYGPWLTEGGVAAPGVISTAAVEIVLNVTRVELAFDRVLKVAGRQQKTLRSMDASLLTTVTPAATQRYLAQQAALRLPLRAVPVQPPEACKDSIKNQGALRGAIALVARGDCTFFEKALSLAAAGAAGAIVYNNNKTDKAFFGMAFDDVPAIPIWAVSYDAGQALLAAAGAAGAAGAGAAAAGAAKQGARPPPQQQQRRRQQQPLRVTAEKASRQPLPAKQRKQPVVLPSSSGLKLVAVQPLSPHGYDLVVEPSAFSSWGPAATLELTPTLAAPGSGMYTATAGSNYTHVDGTSYSAPFVAGALALWRTTRPRIRPQPGRPVVSRAATAVSGGGSSVKETTGSSSSSSKGASSKKERGGPQQAAVQQSWVASTWEFVKHAVFVTGFTAPLPAATVAGQGRGDAAAIGVAAASKRQAAAFAGAPLADKTPGRAAPGSQRPRGGSSPQERHENLAAGEAEPSSGAAAGVGDAAAGYAGQAAAYASFVTTAKPIMWHQQPGWAQPVARVGAGLIQVASAIQNPTTVTPNHLLLRSNRARQSATFTATNAAQFPIAYRLGHTPAAAISMRNTWHEDDPEQLMQAVGASVSFSVAGKAVQQVLLPAGGSVTIEATFQLPAALVAMPALYSGYVTLTPAGPARAAAQPLKALQSKQQQALARGRRQAAERSVQDPVPFAATPLVVPYQGFSANYTTLPILPEPSPRGSPEQAKKLTGLLHVCYSDFAHDDSSWHQRFGDSDAEDQNQDGFLHQPHVDRCLLHPANASGVTKLPLAELEGGYGAIIIGAALLRPALSMQLMLFEAGGCTGKPAAAGSGRSTSAPGARAVQPPRRPAKAKTKAASPATAAAVQEAACAAGGGGGSSRGRLVGELWKYRDPSRDFPGSLWAYYDSFEGRVAIRSPVTQKVVSWRPVALGKPYKMQLWVTGPLAAVDRAAGEQYHVFKYDVPGTFIFV